MNLSEQFELKKELSCGENFYQKAALYKNERMIDYTTDFELSYADILGMSLGLSIASEFYDVNAIVLTDNSTVLATALGQNISEACKKAFDCNPVDTLNSVITSTQKIDIDSAKLFTKGNLVIAPEFDIKALELMQKRSIRYVVLKTKISELKNYITEEVKMTPFGLVIQESNTRELSKDTFKVETKTKPTAEQIEDAVFAWKVSKYIKSYAIVISKDFKTTSISQGISGSAVEYALDYACDASKNSILAADMPLSIYDLNVAAQGRISLIIVPSATKEFIKEADKLNLVLITTGFTNLLA